MKPSFGVLLVLILLVFCAVDANGETVYFLAEGVYEIDDGLPNPWVPVYFVVPLTDEIVPGKNCTEIELARQIIDLWELNYYPRITIAEWDPNNGYCPNRDYLHDGMPAWSWVVVSADLVPVPGIWMPPVEIKDIEQDVAGWIDTHGDTTKGIGWIIAELGPDLSPWEADLTMNETIDANDLLYFSDYWLESGCWHPYWCDGADINGDGTVDFIDFSRLAQYWLWESPFQD